MSFLMMRNVLSKSNRNTKLMLKKNLLKVAEQYISFEGSNSSVLLKSLKTNYLRDNCKINVRLTVEVDGKRTYDKKHYCELCTKRYLKIARYFEDRHKGEHDVKSIMLLKPTPNDTEDVKKKKLQMKILLTVPT